MTTMRRPGKQQRRLLLAAELYRRRHGHGPLWRELAAELGLGKAAFALRVQALHEQGLVAYTEEPRSLRVTPEGLAAALNGRARGK
jgi:DNA-binding IclR family transcriptional regulator